MQTINKPFLTFSLSNNKAAIDIYHVMKIMYIPHTIHIATGISYLQGFIDNEGEIFPLIDIRKKFNLNVHDCDENTAIVVINIKNELIAIIVDTLIDIFNLPVGNHNTTKDMPHKISYQIKNDIIPITIINIDNLFTDEELQEIIYHKNAYVHSERQNIIADRFEKSALWY